LGAQVEPPTLEARVGLEDPDAGAGQDRLLAVRRRVVAGDADVEPEQAGPVEPTDDGGVLGVDGEAAVEAGADASAGAELRAVGAVHRVELIVQIGDDVAEDADTELAPRRRDDQLIDGRAIDAVERGRLVEDVDDAERHEDEPDANAERDALERLELEVRLLDLELVDVLDLELGVDADPVVEAVAEEEDDAPEGELGFVALERQLRF